MIVFVDGKSGRGGGQVVLEELLRRVSPSASTALVMSAEGQQSILIPSNVRTFESLAECFGTVGNFGVALVVANSSDAFPGVACFVRYLRHRLKANVRSVAISHAYPRTPSRRIATKAVLRVVDIAIAVEPGLALLRSDIEIPSWLSVITPSPMPVFVEPFGVKTVKSYARPDRSKGLHLLPAIFSELERDGVTCEVALGSPLESDRRYEVRLRRLLAPWLVSGPRNSSWIEPGDVFVVPSISGEAVCLSAQEAMARGAIVVASRLGLLAYMSPTGSGIRTFAPGDTTSAVHACRQVLQLDAMAFKQECIAGAVQINERAGRWYDDVVGMLVREHEQLVAAE